MNVLLYVYVDELDQLDHGHEGAARLDTRYQVHGNPTAPLLMRDAPRPRAEAVEESRTIMLLGCAVAVLLAPSGPTLWMGAARHAAPCMLKSSGGDQLLPRGGDAVLARDHGVEKVTRRRVTREDSHAHNAGIHGRVPLGGPALLRAHRQGRRRHAIDRGDRFGHKERC